MMEQVPEAAEGTCQLIEKMARLRAGGDSWENVSVLLSRPVRELKTLAWERRAEWTSLFTEAAGMAALEVLADLAHGDDAHVAATAARTLLTHSRWAGGNQPPSHQGHQEGPEIWNAAEVEAAGGMEFREGSPNLVSLCLGGEEKIAKAGEAATERLVELLGDERSWVALRAAQSILVQVRSWWSWTHVRPRAPKPEKKPKGPDWKAILPWQADDAPPPPDRISIHENGKLIGQEGRVVEFARPGVSSESWEKTGAEADEYIRELVQGEKPGVEFMWYGHWLTTHLERIAGRDNIPWPPPEEMVSGRWYAVYDEELRDLRVKPLPDSWQTGDPEPPDGWGPNSRASPN